MKKILVIDDDQDILNAVTCLLKIEGYDVMGLQDAGDAAEQVRMYQPDMMILDIMIAGVDGRSVCRLFKQSPLYMSIPILLFSASRIHEEELVNCGANDFLSKPFDIDNLLDRVDRLLYPTGSAAVLSA